MHAVLDKRENLTTHLIVLLLLCIIFVIESFVSSLLFIPKYVAVKNSVFHFNNEI